jgi:carbon starvation protein CstA
LVKQLFTAARNSGQATSLVSGKEVEQRMLKAFLNYGLVAAVIVWAGVVALMAYRLDDSPWRWAFAALAVGGIATVAVIFKIRRYVDALNKQSGEQGSKS